MARSSTASPADHDRPVHREPGATTRTGWASSSSRRHGRIGTPGKRASAQEPRDLARTACWRAREISRIRYAYYCNGMVTRPYTPNSGAYSNRAGARELLPDLGDCTQHWNQSVMTISSVTGLTITAIPTTSTWPEPPSLPRAVPEDQLSSWLEDPSRHLRRSVSRIYPSLLGTGCCANKCGTGACRKTAFSALTTALVERPGLIATGLWESRDIDET